jgi:hypothetical protein
VFSTPTPPPPSTARRKQAEQEGRAREARLARALEEVERHRAALEEAKARARDGRDAAGAEAARGAAERAKLERQRNALLAAFRCAAARGRRGRASNG